jgi:AcrR family transcriptional regulator
MKASPTRIARNGYKLAQLCQEADFHPSTVHYYVKIGLLHKPRKVGLGLFLYDETHLKKLGKIRALRERENLSLSKIKDRFRDDRQIHDSTESPSSGQARPDESGNLEEVYGARETSITKQKILDVATELFSKKGYEGTTIKDITQALNMSKGSFYLYFSDKKGLFIECIERLTDLIFPADSREELSGEADYIARQAKRMAAFLRAFPCNAGILHLVKISAMGEDQGLASKAKEVFGRIAKPIMQDYRRAAYEGIVRPLDEAFVGYVVLGMVESIGFRVTTDPECDVNECVEKCMDILAHGVLPRMRSRLQAQEPARRSGKITDVRGEAVKVREICFGGKPYLTGRIGEGEIRLDTDRIAFMLLDHTGPECLAEVTMTDGEKVKLEQDGNMIVSAASPFGMYTVPFRCTRSISFA